MLKSLTEYLSAAGGNHETAAAALHADLVKADTDRETEASANIRARTIAKSIEPLAEALGIPLPPPGARPTVDAQTALSEGVSGAIDGLQALEDSLEAWQGIAEDAGLDVKALEKLPEDQQDAFIESFLTGLDSTGTAQELAVYKFAVSNGLNPEAVLLQKGLDGLEQREVKQTVDGKEATVKVWGVPGQNDAFTPALDHLKPVLGALKVTEAKPSGTSWIGGQEAQGNAGGTSAVQARIQARSKDAQAAPDPFKPTHTPNGGNL